ncbi:hypothetical protein ACFL4K_03220 [Candidatus Neomarinimicrobiota bacterium]
MKKVTLLLIILPALLFAQTELGPFVFMDQSKAYNITLDAVIEGGGLAGSASAETAAPAALGFLNFIPGYATRYLFTVGDGVYCEAAVIARARYQPKRKSVGFIGLGPGLGVSTKHDLEFSPTVSVVLGMDYLINEKYVVSVVVRSVGMLNIGFGFHKSYGW